MRPAPRDLPKAVRALGGGRGDRLRQVPPPRVKVRPSSASVLASSRRRGLTGQRVNEKDKQALAWAGRATWAPRLVPISQRRGRSRAAAKKAFCLRDSSGGAEERAGLRRGAASSQSELCTCTCRGAGAGARKMDGKPSTCSFVRTHPLRSVLSFQMPAAAGCLQPRLQHGDAGLRVINVLCRLSLAPGPGGSRHQATKRPAPAAWPQPARREGRIGDGLRPRLWRKRGGASSIWGF